MIILKETQTLNVVLGGAANTNEMPCIVSFREIDTSTYTPDNSLMLTDGATPVDLLDSPASGKQRVIDFISILNTDNIGQQVIVALNDGVDDFPLFKCMLAVGEKLEYQEGQGFRVINNSGSVKNAINQGNSPVGNSMEMVVLGTDVTNNNATANTLASISGLAFPVVAGGTYCFRFVVHYTAAATTTGSRWTILGPGGTMRYRSQYSLTTASRTFNEGLAAHDLPAASNTTSGATASNMAVVEGFYTASADGDVVLRFASEISNSAIIARAGSYCMYQQVL